MNRANADVRQAAKAAGIPLWRIAAELHISEATFTRWMRVPLSEDIRMQVLNLIAVLEREANYAD